MWESEHTIILPRTKQGFFLSSHKGDIIFIKSGKGYLFSEGGWSQLKTLGLLTHKISRVVQSQSRRISLHLPKITPILAVHENRSKSIVLTLPIPFNFLPADTPYSNMCECTNPEGDKLCVATTHQRVGDLPFIFSRQLKIASTFSSHVKHMAVNDDGRIIAIDFDDQLWVWNQLPEEVRGDGNWVNLSVEDRFNYQKYERYNYSYPLSFQKLAVFRNPDEGPGVCFLTCLLPPCKPFDMLYLFNSVCVFSKRKKYHTYYTTIPVLEGHEKPSSFWSPCCRILILSVNQSLILLTRELQIIKTIPLNEVFLGQDPMVSDLAWSCHSQFFMMTSKTGFIGLVTRDGKSLLHYICDLPLFQEDYYQPLNITADTKDPNLYIVYSQRHMRFLRLDRDIIPRTLSNLLSLPFPTKNPIPLFERTLQAIEKVNPSNPYEIVELIYYSDLFGIFRYHSPLRYPIFKKLNNSLSILLEEGHHLLVYFLIRCIFYVTEQEPDAYKEVMQRLAFSHKKRDKVMLRFLHEEITKRDWSYVSSYRPSVIHMHISTNEDDSQMKPRIKPDPKKDEEELDRVIDHVCEIFYDDDFYEVKDIPINVSMLFEMMIDLERFDRAAVLAHHESVAASPVQVLIMISSIHAEDPVALFRAMEVCINSSPIDEPELRAVCILALNNLLKQLISDSSPTAENPRPKMISRICTFEETADIPIPKTREDCNDFAVLCGLAFCAADYSCVQDFCNGKSINIPNQLYPAIRELIRLIWFVRWRYQAMKENLFQKKPGNASLRLIPFPDFINQGDIREAIRSIPKSYYEKEVYELYMEDTGEFENDPEFVDFICEISLRITPRLLSQIQIAVTSFADPFDEIPRSTILTAVVVSHVIPWLRCGIPRAMAKFEKAPEIVPNRLLDFEDFSLLKEKPKPLDFDVKPSIDIPAIVELPDSDEDRPIKDNSDSSLQPPPPPPSPPEMPEEIPTPDYEVERELSEGEEPPKPKTKIKKPKKEKIVSQPKPQKRKKLKLIEVDRTAPPSDTQPIQIPLPPAYATNEVVQGYPFDPLVLSPVHMYPPPVAIFQANHAPFPQQTFGPIWDLDPSLYERPYPRPPPNIPMEEESFEKPQRQTASAQCDAQPKQSTRVFITSRPKDPEFDISDDSCKDISLDDENEAMARIDPFPLDYELNRRVDRLLKNPINIKTTRLPNAPIYTTKIVRKEHIIEHHDYKEVKK